MTNRTLLLLVGTSTDCVDMIRPWVKGGTGADPWPVLIQIPTLPKASQIFDSLQPLVEKYYLLQPLRMRYSFSADEAFQNVCSCLDQEFGEFFALITAKRPGVYCSK